MARNSSLLSLFICATLTAQHVVTTAEPPVYVTAIEVFADVRDASGRVPADLKIDDFALFEDGVERKIIGVEPVAAAPRGAVEAKPSAPEAAPAPAKKTDWQFVVYVDTFLSSTISLRNAADSFSKQAEDLVKLGTVEVVVANPAPSLLLSASRDVAAIRQALKNAVAKGGNDFLVVHRRRYITDTDIRSSSPQRSGTRTGGAEPAPSELIQPVLRLDVVRPYVMEEVQAISRFRRGLLDWLSRYPKQTPRALFLVSGGFEYDPASFYIGFAEGSPDGERARQEFSQLQVGPASESLAQALAAASWTTISLELPPAAGDQWIDDGGRSGIGRVRSLVLDQPRSSSPFAVMNARESLVSLAEATGGSIVNRSKIGEVLNGLSERVKITYQVSRPPDGKPHRIEVRPKRAGLTVRSGKWSSEVTPEELAAARVAKIIRDGEPTGELGTSATLEWTSIAGGKRSGTLTVRTPLEKMTPLLGGRKTSFRVTLLVREKSASHPFVIHRVVTDYDTATANFLYTSPITMPDQEVDAVVAVEELTTGMWGGARVAVR